MFKAHELHVRKHKIYRLLTLEWVEIQYLFRDVDCLKCAKRKKGNETAQRGLLGLHYQQAAISSKCYVCEIATDNKLVRDVIAPSAARESVDSLTTPQTREFLHFCGHSASDSFSSTNWFCSRLSAG